MYSNDPQPLPVGKTASYPIPHLTRPLSAKSKRRRQWAEDQLLPVSRPAWLKHVKPLWKWPWACQTCRIEANAIQL